MKKIRKIAAFLCAVCLVSVSLTSCGEKETDKKETTPAATTTAAKETEPAAVKDTEPAIDEKEIEEAANELEKEEQDDKPAETEAPADEKPSYALTDEVKNAELSSGLTQIGNDVFRMGGYYTVTQFIEEFGDRYDMSTINTDGICSDKNNKAEIVSKSDPNLTVTIYFYSPTEDKCPVGDAVIATLSTNLVKYPENGWFPKGLTFKPTDMKYTDIEPFFESNGFTKLEDDPQNYGYNYDVYTEEDGGYMLYVKGSEKNLFGSYPIYTYDFVVNDETGEISAIFYDVRSFKDTDNWKSTKES